MRMRVPGFFLLWPARRTLSVSPSPMKVTLPFHSLHLGECGLPRMHGPVCAAALPAASASRHKSAASAVVVSLADGMELARVALEDPCAVICSGVAPKGGRRT